MGRLLGAAVAVALVGCSSSSGSGDAGAQLLACISADGCTNPDDHCGVVGIDCVSAPILSCSAGSACMAGPGSVCRDTPSCRDMCNVAGNFTCGQLAIDGGSVDAGDGTLAIAITYVPIYPDGGEGCEDCSDVAVAYPFCVPFGDAGFSVCQACSADSDCGGGLYCTDVSLRPSCSEASDCPGTVGQYVCQ